MATQKGLKKPRYTLKEDQIILLYVKKYPTNLSYAFEKAADRLPLRDKRGCEQRYYNKLRDNMNTYITCGSKRGFTSNVKNNPRRIANSRPNQTLSPLKSLWTRLFNHW